jgi:ribA/ribD-fused uncharacterized protein
MGKGPFIVNEEGEEEGKVRVDELGNDWLCPIVEGSTTYSSVEHYYQANKCVREEERQLILSTEDPKKCARLGRKVEIRPGWDSIKFEVMRRGTRLKYEQHPELRKLIRPGLQFMENPPHMDEWDHLNQKILDEIATE